LLFICFTSFALVVLLFSGGTFQGPNIRAGFQTSTVKSWFVSYSFGILSLALQRKMLFHKRAATLRSVAARELSIFPELLSD
jgi:hypothetical protein